MDQNKNLTLILNELVSIKKELLVLTAHRKRREASRTKVPEPRPSEDSEVKSFISQRLLYLDGARTNLRDIYTSYLAQVSGTNQVPLTIRQLSHAIKIYYPMCVSYKSNGKIYKLNLSLK